MKYSLKAGDRLKHFVIKKPIGHGGMGEVYLAHDESLSRDVAIKTLSVLPEEYADNFANIKRFLSEAKVLAQLSDPSFTTIYYVSTLDEQLPFIVMEYLEGSSLKDYYQSQRVTFSFALKVLQQVSHALSIAHAKDIIHRDIKPANLFVTDSGQVKILDFGIAKWLNDPNRVETKHNEFMGSLMFTPPEILDGDSSHDKIDIYALGITLMTMLEGDYPFQADSQYELMDQIRNDPALFSKSFSRNLPAQLVDLIYQMVEKDPRDRPRNMQEVYQRSLKLNLRGSRSFDVTEETLDLQGDSVMHMVQKERQLRRSKPVKVKADNDVDEKKVIPLRAIAIALSVLSLIGMGVIFKMLGGEEGVRLKRSLTSTKSSYYDITGIDELIATVEKANHYSLKKNLLILKANLEQLEQRGVHIQRVQVVLPNIKNDIDAGNFDAANIRALKTNQVLSMQFSRSR